MPIFVHAPELPQRATIRWQGYDYASVGAYYLTIVHA
jgi:hypothetical protein